MNPFMRHYQRDSETVEEGEPGSNWELLSRYGILRGFYHWEGFQQVDSAKLVLLQAKKTLKKAKELCKAQLLFSGSIKNQGWKACWWWITWGFDLHELLFLSTLDSLLGERVLKRTNYLYIICEFQFKRLKDPKCMGVFLKDF